MRSFAEQRDFKALLLADADVTRVLSPAEIERAFDLDEQLKHVDAIFDRVFHGVRSDVAPSRPGRANRQRRARCGTPRRRMNARVSSSR